MNIGAKDLNLLKVFHAVWLERHVGRAGERLGLSQPAASNALNRLRDTFGDSLFVRVPKGMAPTPLAESLAPKIISAISTLETIFAPSVFDPRTLKRKFVIAGSDYYGQFVLPGLVATLRDTAPNSKVLGRSLQGAFPKLELENGDVDIAIAGFFKKIPQNYYTQKLFDETFVCVLRKGHPALETNWTVDTYCEYEHLLISPQGDLHGMADVALEAIGKSRRVVCGIDNFFTPGWIVAKSDLILTAPRSLAAHYQSYLPVEQVEVPIELPAFSVVQVWHERTAADPANVWLRQTVRDLALKI